MGQIVLDPSMSARAALLETLASYLGDRKLLALIGTTVTGVALNAHSIRSNASFLSLYTAASASATPQTIAAAQRDRRPLSPPAA